MLRLLKGICTVGNCFQDCIGNFILEPIPAMSQKQSHMSFSRTQGFHNSNNILRIKCSMRMKIFDIWVGLIIGLISAWLANVPLVPLRQGVIPLELYGKGLSFGFIRGIWDVPMPCNYIPVSLGCFSKMKFHSWLWPYLMTRISRDSLSL